MSGRSQPLGQHFLGSEQLAARLVRDSGVGDDDRVVDIGAGTGLITAALATSAATVIAVELDPVLAARLVRRFERIPNVTIFGADVRDVPLPRTPYRVVANPPFGQTAAVLHRLLDDPGGGLVRADVVVQWQVARHRARVSEGGPADLLGATWDPWWQFARGRRLPAACFRPRPSVDAAVLQITRRAVPALPAEAFEGFARYLGDAWRTTPDAPQIEMQAWTRRYRTRK